MLTKSILAMLAAIASLAAFDHSYTKFDALLKSHVCQDGVDYDAVKQDPDFKDVHKRLSGLTADQYDAFTDKQKIAYLINVYNFYTLKLIIDNQPLKKGIRDIKNPWDRTFVPFKGNEVSLDHLEHDVLRKNFNEPRIHFAVVCASQSCPELQDFAFTPDKLDDQLDAAAQEFLRDTSRNVITDKKMELSKIFEWYGKDFKERYGSYTDYIQTTLGLEGKYNVSFLEYDWSLNDASCGEK
ncbi:MAG: DUF547 domain-containing protein [Chitinivibrionales bacterium]|nr:DUF547 domain-containing protein [Chitinivibrionales bacterium]